MPGYTWEGGGREGVEGGSGGRVGEGEGGRKGRGKEGGRDSVKYVNEWYILFANHT